MLKKSMTILVTALFFAPTLFAQQGSEQTVEELYLQTTIEMQVIRSLAQNESRQEKLRALDFIGDMIAGGRIDSSNPEIIGVLMDLGGEGVTTQIRTGNRVLNDFPEIRRAAAEYLGQIGGSRAREALVDMALRDPEPMVLSEAVYSLGLIEPDEDGRVEYIISEIVRRQDAVRPDNNFAYAALASIENIARARGGQIRPEVFNSIIQIAQGNYIRPVRQKALQVLDQLRRM